MPKTIAFDPTALQSRALDAIDSWYTNNESEDFYLAGYAGTGKTTLVSYYINQVARLHSRTATFTGKAASVLRKKGVWNASTIHRLIYVPIHGSNPVEFELRSDPISADLIVLDEVSMVDGRLADDIRSFGIPMLVIGDPGQLPPIKGEGAFTRRDPDFMLTEIHRQAANSPVLKWATAARLYQNLPMAGPDAQLLQFTLDRALEPLSDDHQIICGTHRTRWNLTAEFRRRAGYSEFPYPRAGEPVICCRNDRQLGIFNGMIGRAVSNARLINNVVCFDVEFDETNSSGDPQIISIESSKHLFDEHQLKKSLGPPEYIKGQQLFDFGYVITCHKAQGSEWESVTIVDDSYAFRDMREKWLYTAITRASKRVRLLRGKLT